MRRKCGDRRDLVRAGADLLAAVAAVLRREHQLPLDRVVVAFGPAVVAARFQKQQFFGRQRGFLFGLVQIRPIRMQLIASVLGHEQAMAGGIDAESLAVADSRRIALGGRKPLVGPVGVIAPDAAAGLEFRARLGARRFQLRFFCWQEFVAVATSTYMNPSALMANGCMG